MIHDRDIAYLIRALAVARGWRVSTASRIVSGSWDTVDRIDRHGTLTQRRARRILEAVSEHWPTDLPWPEGIERPRIDEKDVA
ncbi:hypothetical protein [Rubellimicrobium thermophilum]|uniref:hypothetical protein n=1 Tax=Rubellimicrobium thermophilum TaxID=295419 RepID=UPI001B7FD7B5|nr:hypothetical protein [Rubellimicrobium thermophilum]